MKKFSLLDESVRSVASDRVEETVCVSDDSIHVMLPPPSDGRSIRITNNSGKKVVVHSGFQKLKCGVRYIAVEGEWKPSKRGKKRVRR